MCAWPHALTCIARCVLQLADPIGTISTVISAPRNASQFLRFFAANGLDMSVSAICCLTVGLFLFHATAVCVQAPARAAAGNLIVGGTPLVNCCLSMAAVATQVGSPLLLLLLSCLDRVCSPLHSTSWLSCSPRSEATTCWNATSLLWYVHTSCHALRVVLSLRRCVCCLRACNCPDLPQHADVPAQP